MKTVETTNYNRTTTDKVRREDIGATSLVNWRAVDDDGFGCHDDNVVVVPSATNVTTTAATTKVATAIPQATTPTMTTTTKKYSKEYFEEQIQTMKSTLKTQLPKIDSKNWESFVSSCQTYQDVKTNLTQANSLLDSLQKKQKKNQDDNKADDKDLDDLIEKAQALVDTTQSSLDDILIVCTNTARIILDELFQNNNSNGQQSKLLECIDETMLLQCTILIQCTPTALSKWCLNENQLDRNGPLFDEFLNSKPCMKLSIKNGGAVYGQYYNTVDLYDKIEHSSQMNNKSNKKYRKKNKKKHIFDINETDADADMRQKLTMAIALQLAKPILHFHAKDNGDDDNCYVDPIQRYWHYVNTYESVTNNDLDDVFDKLSIFDLRYVINSDAIDRELTWGRSYLKNYRPDQILTKDTQWKYCRSVRTDVNYRHPDHKFDSYQELLSAGGECGPRAFFGRFICKSFGIPTWGCRQPGHAAMTHYTQDKGWLVCLGAAWKYSWWDDERYGATSRRNGPDFYQETQARRACAKKSGGSQNQDLYYETVCILECIAEILDETVQEDVTPNKVWRSLALMSRKIHADSISTQQQQEEEAQERSSSSDYNKEAENTNEDDFEIIDSSDDDCCGSSSRNNNDSFKDLSINENVGSKVLPKHQQSSLFSPSPRRKSSDISITSCGSIVIPATSFTVPSKPTANVLSMPSFLGGGTQLHLEHDGSVEYVLPDCISEGSYMLSCRLVNVHIINQVPLLLSIEKTNNSTNNHKDNQEATVDLYSINVEYTGGAWRTTSPIKVDIGPKCTLKFSREQPCHGLSIKDFTCQPC